MMSVLRKSVHCKFLRRNSSKYWYISDAASLLDAEQGAVDHMNVDHREAMNLYATRLLGAAPADWRCTGCDPEGIDMQAGTTTQRLEFPRRIVTPAALRQVLKDLAVQARTATVV